jgi:hypothetical protein
MNFITAGGFMPPELGPTGLQLAPSGQLFQRSIPEAADLNEQMAALQRGETLDNGVMLAQLQATLAGLSRGITSGMTAFPVRENLEAEVAVLVPVDTPVRNMIPRVPGAGTAVAWRQATSLGGGWGTSVDQPGGGSAAQIFFGESGAPAELTTVYAAKSAGYKLMGQRGSVTGFAMASGANFMNQLAMEKTNSIMNLMLNEEYALISGDATSTSAPWGDGTTAFAFNGLINLITTANGTPSAQVQTSVGALTFAHIDAQLTLIWNRGGRNQFILVNSQEARSIRNLASNASNGLYKIVAEGTGNGANAGLFVNGYVHPITGEVIPIKVSKFVPAGTMLFGSLGGPIPGGGNGNAIQVNVLPQVQLPELAPNQPIQGYTAQEIAPAYASPQVFGFITSVYEVLQMRNATVFAKSTGVTAV